jgi:hypothetical protein
LQHPDNGDEAPEKRGLLGRLERGNARLEKLCPPSGLLGLALATACETKPDGPRIGRIGGFFHEAFVHERGHGITGRCPGDGEVIG